MFVLLIAIIVLIVMTLFHLKQSENVICKPPNKFVQVFAPPGVGKTTLAAKIVRESIAENKRVFSNVPIIHAEQLDLKDLGKYMIRDCVIIIDEAGSQVGNRSWHTNLDKKQIDFLKKHRHYNIDIYLFSQAGYNFFLIFFFKKFI